MISREDRNSKIQSLESMFGNALGIYLTDINRVDVRRMMQLRKQLRSEGYQYIVVKNKLAKIALDRCGKSDMMPYLKGPIGIVFANDEATGPARVLRDFQRDNKDLLEVRAVYVEGAVLKGSDCARLADIPSREVLLAQLLGVLKAPVQKVASTLNGIMGKFVNALDQVRTQKESEQPA